MWKAPPPGGEDEEFWRDFLTNGDARERRIRGLLRHVPEGPRCRLCAAPFAGVGAPLMRLIGKRPSDKDPAMCNSCFDFVVKHRGGAEIVCSFLFADVRGSTAMAERMSATAFRGLLNRFYKAAADVVFAHDGSVDKFVGDELVAMFFSGMGSERDAERAVATAQGLLAATGHGAAEGPWIPVGAGVHRGPAWVGAVGDGAYAELTALGDTVNTAARLASAAAAGEALITLAAADAAGLGPGLERRSLDLKGKEQPTEVVVLRA